MACRCDCDRCKYNREFYSAPHPAIAWRRCYFCGHDIAETIYDRDAEIQYARGGVSADCMLYVCFCCDFAGRLKGVSSIFINYIPEVLV